MTIVACEDSCVLCGTHRAKHLIDYAGRERKLVRCCNCGLVRVEPFPTLNETLSFHDTEEYWYEHDEDRIPVFEEVLNTVARYCVSGCILDVGCGKGTFLNLARSRGYDPIGVELSGDACRCARQQWDLDVRHGTVVQQHFDSHSIEVITGVQMIYYPRNPIDELREYRRIISKDGVLVLVSRCNRWSWAFSMCSVLHQLRHGTPMQMSESVVSRFLTQWGTFTGNYMFTTHTLKALLNKSGWVVQECRNQRAIERGKHNLQSRLCGIYRHGCNVLERTTLGNRTIGLNIVVVASPTGIIEEC